MSLNKNSNGSNGGNGAAGASSRDSNSTPSSGSSAKSSAPSRKGSSILVMGGTGTGKSAFIKLVTGNNNVKVGHKLESETSSIESHPVPLKDGGLLMLVDTPGFDDNRPGASDVELLGKISEFLTQEHTTHIIRGLVYLLRITDNRLDGTTLRNLRMFSKICGPEAMKSVIILTTRWDELEQGVGEMREKQIISGYLQDFRRDGAEVMRHDNTPKSAVDIVNSILKCPHIEHLQVLDELSRGMPISQTGAGRELYAGFEKLRAQHLKRIEDLQQAYEEVQNEDLQAQKEELEAQVRNLEEAVRALGVPPSLPTERTEAQETPQADPAEHKPLLDTQQPHQPSNKGGPPTCQTHGPNVENVAPRDVARAYHAERVKTEPDWSLVYDYAKAGGKLSGRAGAFLGGAIGGAINGAWNGVAHYQKWWGIRNGWEEPHSQ